MINRVLQEYDYFTIGGLDDYGFPTTSAEPTGKVKIAIYLASQSIQDNINYENCNYVGLTQDNIDSSFVINYGEEKLKVIYVNPQGRMKQVFMVRI